MNLNGMVALITGPKGGLGGSVTTAFLEAGARVAGVSRTIREASEGSLQRQFSKRQGIITGDLRSRLKPAFPVFKNRFKVFKKENIRWKFIHDGAVFLVTGDNSDIFNLV